MGTIRLLGEDSTNFLFFTVSKSSGFVTRSLSQKTLVKATKNKGLLASHRRSKKRQAIPISFLLRLGMELGERLLGTAGIEEYPHGPGLT